MTDENLQEYEDWSEDWQEFADWSEAHGTEALTGAKPSPAEQWSETDADAQPGEWNPLVTW